MVRYEGLTAVFLPEGRIGGATLSKRWAGVDRESRYVTKTNCVCEKNIPFGFTDADL